MSDLMLLGILRMPVSDNPKELSATEWVQIKSAMREAATRIETDADALKAQAKEIAELKKELNAWHESANWPEKSPGRMRARIAELEATLRFYADPQKFTDCNGDDVQVPDFYDELDFGATARAALKGEEG